MVANWNTEKCFRLNEDTLQETKPSCGTACATKRLECWIHGTVTHVVTHSDLGQ